MREVLRAGCPRVTIRNLFENANPKLGAIGRYGEVRLDAAG